MPHTRIVQRQRHAAPTTETRPNAPYSILLLAILFSFSPFYFPFLHFLVLGFRRVCIKERLNSNVSEFRIPSDFWIKPFYNFALAPLKSYDRPFTDHLNSNACKFRRLPTLFGHFVCLRPFLFGEFWQLIWLFWGGVMISYLCWFGSRFYMTQNPKPNQHK